MEKKEQKILFNIVQVKTDQFALFEENHLSKGKINLTTNLTYGMNTEINEFLTSTKFIFEMMEKPFMTIQVSCFFDLEASSLEYFKSDSKFNIPKEFIAHMAMITVGTTRGVLHTKTEGTPFNQYILPTINVAQMIPEDAVFDIVSTN